MAGTDRCPIGPSEMTSTAKSSPVFLTGFPKSGTTLLLSLLDGHPDLNVFPKETLFFQFAVADLQADRDRGIQLFVERIFEGVLFGLEDVLEDSVGADRYLAAFKDRWSETGFAMSRFLDIAVETYGELIGRSGRRFWVEKTPHTELHVPMLASWYPTMKAIHCVRDPRANWAAIRVWNDREGRPTGFPRIASHWKRSWAAAKHNASIVPHHVVRYEDLVESTEASMRKICEFLEIDFDPTLLEPTLGGEPFQGNSMYKERFSGVSKASLDRWRSVLSDEDVKEVEWLLRREFDEMGYERHAGHPGWSARSLAARLSLLVYSGYDALPASWKKTFRAARGDVPSM
jgi:hypothetical protein